jgi:hypothetical protein
LKALPHAIQPDAGEFHSSNVLEVDGKNGSKTDIRQKRTSPAPVGQQ